jgi:hypothetical protein
VKSGGRAITDVEVLLDEYGEVGWEATLSRNFEDVRKGHPTGKRAQ